jgi:hypothetical protein
MSQQPTAPQPVICEYFIQNDESDTKRSPYPNIFILPKKYLQVTDVRVRDVVEAFPLATPDSPYKYQLRF